MSLVNGLIYHARDTVGRRFRKPFVPDKPHFDEESSSYFFERLALAKSYLEYGTGGSTMEAARQNKVFASVESDATYLEAVRKRIVQEFGESRGRLIHADIGLTGAWGYPVFKNETPSRVSKWSGYAKAPWKDVRDVPDLILVDGRFRVHCALYSVAQLKGRDFELLVDDYLGRAYEAIEEFASLKEMRGRMAVFGPAKFDDAAMGRALDIFARDPR